MGKAIVNTIGVWLIVKSILNTILSFGLWNVIMIVLSVAVLYVFYLKIPYMNYVVAVLLLAVVLKNLWYNITNVQILYIIEGVIDLISAYFLCFNKEVKEYFAK